jgi:hypothetical protein
MGRNGYGQKARRGIQVIIFKEKNLGKINRENCFLPVFHPAPSAEKPPW